MTAAALVPTAAAVARIATRLGGMVAEPVGCGADKIASERFCASCAF